MLKKITIEKLIFIIYIAIEAAIYITFNVIAAAGAPDPIYLKYFGVLLGLGVSVFLAVKSRGKTDFIILSIALLFTAISDLFILVLDKYYEIGLITFILVQTMYFCRLYAGRLKKVYISLAARLALMVILIALFAALDMLNLLIAECAVYIVMLVGNVVDAFVLCKKSAENLLFAIGLLLFLCCDICVGLDNGVTVLGLNLPQGLVVFLSYAIWVFYLPSQALITCSADGVFCKTKRVENTDEVATVYEEAENDVVEG